MPALLGPGCWDPAAARGQALSSGRLRARVVPVLHLMHVVFFFFAHHHTPPRRPCRHPLLHRHHPLAPPPGPPGHGLRLSATTGGTSHPQGSPGSRSFAPMPSRMPWCTCRVRLASENAWALFLSFRAWKPHLFLLLFPFHRHLRAGSIARHSSSAPTFLRVAILSVSASTRLAEIEPSPDAQMPGWP